MAEAAVSFLMENLTQLLKHQTNLISGAEEELRQLYSDVDRLKAFLQQVGKNPKEEGELKEIRDAVYEMQDAIDACLTEKAATKQKNTFRRHFTHRRIELPKLVKSLRENLVKPILDRVNAYDSTVTHDAPTASVEEPWIIRKKVHAIRMDKVVGLEDEEDAIIGYLCKENEGLDVISIIGMSGMGKTTLARKIYQSEHIVFAFTIRLWINVSQNFSKRDVILNILKSFSTQDMSSMSDEELIQTALACLKEEKFFLIFDDVCNVEDWQAIQEFLPMSNGMGKVLITSSNKNVGAYENNNYRKSHQLRFLNDEESWMLLQLEVFGNLEDCPPELVVIGKLIASKCRGRPLQIVAVGGILVDQLMKSPAPSAITRGWEKVSQNVDLFLHNETSISNALGLTYSGLPEEFRVCLLYMGVFPEDYEISTWTLARLWIAEGFVQPKGEMSLEETAIQNLDDLISRNLVMASRINPSGEVKSCRVHDMIRAFCIQKAEEQSLFREMKKTREGVVEPPVSEIQESRRLCVYSNVDKLLSQLPKSQRVRSFLCFTESSINAEPSHTSAIPDAFSLLRVLESQSIKFDQMPQGITRLFHLRYITLSVDDLNILPETLSELWNLQTLVVHTRSRLIIMKASIWRLIRLRHLKTNAAIALSSDMKGVGGENLQTLNNLSPESCTEDVCTRARDLKTLGIRGKLATIYQNFCLGKLTRLEKLKLVNDLFFEEGLHVDDFPHRNFFPPNLKRLTLSNTYFQWKHMPTLANINNLQVLKLKDNAFVGIYWNAAEDCFPNLQVLIISHTDLVQWEASTSSFPKLSCLQLKSCENLNEIPQALAKTLEELDVDRLRKSAVVSARRIADEKRKGQELEEAKWEVPKFKLHIGTAY